MSPGSVEFYWEPESLFSYGMMTDDRSTWPEFEVYRVCSTKGF
jgi:hypothetical protein